MRELTKADMQAIVDRFGYLINQPYSEEFHWEADVGNMVSPLEFAAHCNVDGRLLTILVEEAESAADYLQQLIDEHDAQCDCEDQRSTRDCSLLPDDILRNIVEHCVEELGL